MKQMYSIMWNSFHENFYVDKSSVSQNKEYLFRLVDKAVEKNQIKDEDYQSIAEWIYFYDLRVLEYLKKSLIFTMPFLNNRGISFEHLLEKYVESFVPLSDEEENILAYIFTNQAYKEFALACSNWIVISNIDKLNVVEREKILNTIKESIKNIQESNTTILFCLGKYTEPNITEANKLVLSTWYATKVKKRFNHQLVDNIPLFDILERCLMYYDVYSSMKLRDTNKQSSYGISHIIRSAYGFCLFDAQIQHEDIDSQVINSLIDADGGVASLLTTNVINSKKLMCAYKDIYNAYIQNLKHSHSEESNGRSLQTEILKLRNIISTLSHENAEYQRNIENLREIHSRDTESLIKEVNALRTYIFEQTSEEPLDYINNDIPETNDYSDVAIIGGHIKWQQKIRIEMPNIRLIHSDINVLDFSFLSNVSTVVFIVGHLSHSLYYRTIENITSQKLIYSNTRNIDKLKSIINSNRKIDS